MLANSKYFLVIGLIIPFLVHGTNNEVKVFSPNKKLEIQVTWDKTIEINAKNQGKNILHISDIFLEVDKKLRIGDKLILKNSELRTIEQVINPVVKLKSAKIDDHYNELQLQFESHFGLFIRVYNEGYAYRFYTEFDEPVVINSESAFIKFSPQDIIYFPKEERMMSHNERNYQKLSVNQLETDAFCSLPALVVTEKGNRVLITESDLTDYPGMWLRVDKKQRLSAKFAGFPLEFEMKRDRDEWVTKHADYIAKTNGKRNYPWRAFVISDSDAGLLTNQLVYLLSPSSNIEDPSWIKTGKVAWDWWNANNIYGVDFKSGVNTETYKYYIDFASQYGIEYVILDEGWYQLGDLTKLTPEMDVPEIIVYSQKKNVGIILWVVWKTLDEQLDEALKLFEKWGVVGLKVDFMQRDDQIMVNYYHKIAYEAAKRKMLVDFHGSYKPAGLHRMYPNVLTREGVKGLEHCKWSKDITPEHNCTIPFIRMVTGPMDYTPGAMINTTISNFNPVFSQPMSMGTRCHQLALYVIFESPLQMLADNPSNYLKEAECMEFLSAVECEWDETIVLHASIGDYIVMARRNGNDWFIGAIGDENTHKLGIDFSFLESGKYHMKYYQDGINADRHGSDFKKQLRLINSTDQIQIKLAPGGGWAAHLIKADR